MFSLYWLLLLWIILLIIFFIFSFFTILMNLRFGLASLATYGSTVLFLGVTAFMIFFTAIFFFTVDWSQIVQPLNSILFLFRL